jgi:hypothetical protein
MTLRFLEGSGQVQDAASSLTTMSINPYAIAEPAPDEMDLFGEEEDAVTHPSTSAYAL